MTPTTPPSLDALRATLDEHAQSHLLTYLDDLDEAQRGGLLAQLGTVDFSAIAPHLRGDATDGPAIDYRALEPAPYYDATATRWDRSAMRAAGESLVREGRLAAFTVAGGQGTRLGWNGPKGTYPATPNTGKPLFRCFAEQILAAERRYGVTIPWYIMTSPINDEATRSFFTDNNCFGLRRSNIFMFPQGVCPSFDPETGRMFLEARDAIAVNPDGHGGSIKALGDSGALEDMRARGVEHISYFQVDNPLVNVIDPEFLALHATAPDSSGEMSSKMVAKAGPDEKVGVFAHLDGRTIVVEYSDLPDELAHATNDDGSLRFNAGSIAIHLMSVAFVDSLMRGGSFALPFHRARKKVPYLDVVSGERVDPVEANAIKLETFVFDALAFADKSIVLETERTDEFAPIKNASGTDSPATSHQLQSDRAGRWLEAAGVEVPRGEDGHVNASIEISPLTALDASDLLHIDLPERVERGAEFVL